MKKNTTKKAILAIALTILCFSSRAQVNKNLFFGYTPMGSMWCSIMDSITSSTDNLGHIRYDTTWTGCTYSIVDGFSFSKDLPIETDEGYNAMDLRINYLHGRNRLLSRYTDFRQITLQMSRTFRLNNKHRVQFPISIGLVGGYGWTQGKGSLMVGLGFKAKMIVYITDRWGVFAGANALGTFGLSHNIVGSASAYLDFGLSYTILN